MLNKADELIVVIGSGDSSNTFENPFSVEERARMIAESMPNQMDRIRTICIDDVHDDVKWGKLVLSKVGRVDVVFSNDNWVGGIFRNMGLIVEEPPFFARNLYSGTHIKKLMREGGSWQELVPDGTKKVLKEIGAPERLKAIKQQRS
ncbi:Nicotinamide-nucleotide adenylyltransferase [uncultured archaeon]|nr:Nicotinamide-nucleotide adenylyltransferase [uncultured archaeon]